MMIPLSLSIGNAEVDLLKVELRRKLLGVKSSHRAEVLARWLGFQTYASLRAALTCSNILRACVDWPSARLFLRSRGYPANSEALYDATAIVALRQMREKLPRLSEFGIGFGPMHVNSDGTRESVNQYNARFRRSREALCSDDSAKAFLRSVAFLSEVDQIKTINASGSYWVKHIAENFPCSYPCGKELGPDYVPNGILIAAAVHIGFEFRTQSPGPYHDTVNVCFNMSRRSLIELDCKFRPDGSHAQSRKRRAEARRFRYPSI